MLSFLCPLDGANKFFRTGCCISIYTQDDITWLQTGPISRRIRGNPHH